MKNLLITLTYVILICGNNAETPLFKNHFQVLVKSVANIYHSNWRVDFLLKNPFVKNRFKLTTAMVHYNPSDFLYPMILTVGSCLVHRNLKVARARHNASLIYVDILNMNYNELPSDWAFENRATARVACRHILRYVRQKRLFNKNLIEDISETIHVQWMKRNAHRANAELMVPYANLTDFEKDKDRKAVLFACRVYNELNFHHRFNTTPVYLSQYIL